MKSILRLPLLATILLILGLAHPSFSQCPNDNYQVPGDLTAPGLGLSNSQGLVAGSYMLAYVDYGANYTVTTCGTSSFDTQLTIYDDLTGAFYGYNDDNCGLGSTVSFNSPVCGYVRIELDQYSCNNSGAGGTVVTMTRNTDGVVHPVVTANTPKPFICLGDSSLLYKVLSGPPPTAAFSWSGSIADSTWFSPTLTSDYIVMMEDGTRCTTDTITVTVNTPVVTANTSTPVVCAKDTVILYGGGDPDVTYAWSGGITDSVKFIASSTTTYRVIGTNANGCSNIDIVTQLVTVNDLPVVTASTTTPVVCAGDTVILYEGGTADTYSWSGGITNNTEFVPANTASYTVTGTFLSTGCKDTATQIVTVNVRPTVTANTLTPVICDGDEVVLYGDGADSYTWDLGVTDNVAFVPSTDETYTVIGVDINGCKDTSTQAVSINALPTVTVVTSTPVICNGEDALLYGDGADTYIWTGGVTDNVVFNPSATDTYTVTGTDVNGCKNTATQTVRVRLTPSLVISDPSVCNPATTADISAVSITAGSTAGISYTYFTDAGATLTYATPTMAEDGTYYIKGTIDSTNCSAVTDVTVTVKPLPVATTTLTTPTFGGPTINADETALGVTYQWISNCGTTDDIILNAITQNYTPAATGEFSVVVTLNGCTQTSDCVTIDLTGVPDAQGVSLLTIYPNPNNGVFTIQSAAQGSYKLINELGQTISTFQLDGMNNYSATFENIKNGVYMIVGTNADNSRTINKKIVVSR